MMRPKSTPGRKSSARASSASRTRGCLTGLGAYTDDRQVVRVLHVAFRRSDQSHARIRAIDCSAARAAPGVVAVFTAEDLSDQVKPLVATSRMANYYATPILPLARGKVRYVGEPVVGIVARKPLSGRGRARAYRHRLRAAAGGHRSGTGRARRRAAVARGSRHQCAGEPRVQARRRRCGVSPPRRCASRGRFRMRRKTPVAIEPRACLAEYDAGREALTLHSATQMPGIVRDALAMALDIPGHRDPRRSRRMSAAASAAKARSIRRRFLSAPWRGGLVRAVKWTGDRMEDLVATSQGFDEIVDAELALDARRPSVGAARRCHRRRRRLFDLSVDGGVSNRCRWSASFPAPIVSQHYRGRVRGVATSKAPTRSLSRRRPADLDLRHGAADGYGGGKTRHRRQGNPAAQSRRRRRASLQGRVRHRLGQIGLSGMPERRLRRDRLRRAARQAESGARRRPLDRHRHRLLCRTDRHRLAHLGGAGHADQYRHRNGGDPHRFNRRASPRHSASPRMARAWRRRWRRSSPNISACASKMSASCRATAPP